MKRCLIITGGPADPEFVSRFLEDKKYEYVIAVDAGLQVCKQLGIKPDLLVGDFDTYGREEILRYENLSECKLDIHRPEKDETDTELAFSDAAAAGFTEADVIGATGGRLDHELSNIFLAAQARNMGLFVNLYDRQNRVYVLDAKLEKKHTFEKKNMYGTYISFLPLSETVSGITLTGFRYPLHNKTISMRENPGLCVSNEIEEGRAELTFSQGVLLCMETKDRT